MAQGGDPGFFFIPTMDIDSPPPLPPLMEAGKEGENKVSSSQVKQQIIKIHPLAIIGISDHHTRVVSGGSALPPSSPVVGLLFGYYATSKTGKVTTIVDAEEMEYPKLSLFHHAGEQVVGAASDNDDESNQRIRAAILQKIELHQKVFPQHRVVGWYRVVVSDDAVAAKSDHEHEIMNVEGELQHQQHGGGKKRTMILHNQQPTEEDLIMTQTEMTRYCCINSNGGDSNDNSGADSNGPLFVLMDASKADEELSVKKSTSTTTAGEKSDTTTALEELESGDELPLTVYTTFATDTTPTTPNAASSDADNSVVFVSTDFELETYEPERIAVERVFKTQPPTSIASSASKSTASSCSSSAAVGMVEGRAAGDTAGVTNRKAGKKSKKDTDMQKQQPHPQQQKQQQSSNKPAFTRGPNELDTQLVTLQSSIRAMNLRVCVLLEYLQKVERREIPPEDALLRSIDGLVRQLPFVLAALEERADVAMDGSSPLGDLEKEYNNAMLLSYLACTAKTAKAVHVFCEKVRAAYESGKSDPRRPLY